MWSDQTAPMSSNCTRLRIHLRFEFQVTHSNLTHCLYRFLDGQKIPASNSTSQAFSASKVLHGFECAIWNSNLEWNQIIGCPSIPLELMKKGLELSGPVNPETSMVALQCNDDYNAHYHLQVQANPKKIPQKTDGISSIYGRNGITPWHFF